MTPLHHLPADHRLLAAGGLLVLLGVSAYTHHLAGYPPLPVEPAMRLADLIRRRPTPSAPAIRQHRRAVLPRAGLQVDGGDLDRFAERLAEASAPPGRALLEVALHADDGRVTPIWSASQEVLDIPAGLWGEGVLVVPASAVTSTTATVGQRTAYAELALVGSHAHPAGPSELTRLLAIVYGRLDPDQREHAVARVGLRPAADGLWAVQVWVQAWSDQPRAARRIRNQVVSAVTGCWSGPTGRWEQVAPTPTTDRAADRERLADATKRLRWVPSQPTVLPTAALAAWLLPATGAQATHAEKLDPGQDPQAPAVAAVEEVAAPPPLPVYTGQPDLAPLGEAAGEIVGVPTSELLFAVTLGQAGFGKSTSAEGRFVHMVTRTQWRGQPWGGLFLDPHEDSLHRVKAHLVALGVPASRIVEIVLTADKMLGWNVLAVDHAREIPDRAGAVVGAFSAAFGWSSRSAPHLQGALDAAARVLLEVSLAVREAGRPHLTPTVFQIATLLTDPEWRAYACAFCEDDSYAQPLEIGNAPSITTPIMRLRGRPEIVALLGNPTGAYDIRAAADDGKIVLLGTAIPGADRDLQQLVAHLFVRDLIRAGLSRRDIRNPANRRPFWVTADEAHNLDAAGLIDTIVSELRKFGVRAEFLTQFPSKLRDDTWRALGTNAGQVITTALDPNEAREVAKRWPGVGPATITGLGRHEFLAQVQLDGRKPRPFRVRSVQPGELFGPPATDEQVAAADAEVDRLLHRRPADEVAAELTGRGGRRSLDARLLDWMRRHAPADRVHLTDLQEDGDPDGDDPPSRRGPRPYRADRP